MYDPDERIQITDLVKEVKQQQKRDSDDEDEDEGEENTQPLHNKNDRPKENADILPSSIITNKSDKNYAILELLGKGEFGSVFKAFDREREKYVAIKMLDMDLYNNSLNDYLNESLILKNLSQIHPNNFPEYHETLEIEKTKCLWISMQAGDASLSDMIEYRIKYLDEEIIYIISEITKALNLAWKMGIAHGDVKLADVVLFKENNKINYKLIDFGISHRIPPPEEELLECQIRGFTPNYASPELSEIFSDKYSPKNLLNVFKFDIYAVGVLILYLMGLNWNKIKAIKENLQEITKYENDYPNSIKLVKKLLKEDPKKRIDYNKLDNLLASMKSIAKVPQEDFFISRYQENKLKSLSENDLENYKNLYVELKNFELAKKFALHILDKAKSYPDNTKRIADCYEKCGDLEILMNNLKKSLENYNEALNLICKSEDISEIDHCSSVIEKKKVVALRMNNEKN